VSLIGLRMLPQRSGNSAGRLYSSNMGNKGDAVARRWKRQVVTFGDLWCRYDTWKTDIFIDDWKDASQTFFHHVEKMQFVSLPNRRAQLEVIIKRQLVAPNDDIRTEITERLNTFSKTGRTMTLSSGRFSSVFTMTFTLLRREKFLEMAVDVAKWFFKTFGLPEDPKKYRLSYFKLHSEDLVLHKGSWIPFIVWWKMVRDLHVHPEVYKPIPQETVLA